jgi:hypothetical protein
MGYVFSHHGPLKGITLALPVICSANQASVKNTDCASAQRFLKGFLRVLRALRGKGVGQVHTISHSPK